MRKITPPIGSIKKLMEEFDVTRTTVHQSLSFYNNSDVAEAIRKRAVELIKESLNEANKSMSTIKK